MRFMKMLMACFLVLILSFSSLTPAFAAASIRETDVANATEGNCLVTVTGTYSGNLTKALKLINKYRKEACDKNYINPSTGKKLKSSDYTPIKASKALCWIAETRAAEATVVSSHTRPNGSSCFTAKYGGVQSWGEVLAWNGTGLLYGIKQWYGEKKDWVNQNSNAVTGHYTQMIDPDNKFVGLGCFRLSTGGYYAAAGEFSSYENLTKCNKLTKGKRRQVIEIEASKVTVTTSKMTLGLSQTKTFKPNVSIGGVHSGKLYKVDSLVSSDDTVVKITKSGKLKTIGVGTAVVKVTYGGDKTKRVKVFVE
ncbi:MAG: CAP domain-containing protein [Lachnospiraceae bacterium]|nr:CAP domain-containing protein [Lachnospiraceae bacterium]